MFATTGASAALSQGPSKAVQQMAPPPLRPTPVLQGAPVPLRALVKPVRRRKADQAGGKAPKRRKLMGGLSKETVDSNDEDDDEEEVVDWSEENRPNIMPRSYLNARIRDEDWIMRKGRKMLRPGRKAEIEVDYYQNGPGIEGFVFSPGAFARLARNVLLKAPETGMLDIFSPNKQEELAELRWEKGALLALQNGAESYMQELLGHALLAMRHRQALTLDLSDVVLVLRITSPSTVKLVLDTTQKLLEMANQRVQQATAKLAAKINPKATASGPAPQETRKRLAGVTKRICAVLAPRPEKMLRHDNAAAKTERGPAQRVEQMRMLTDKEPAKAPARRATVAELKRALGDDGDDDDDDDDDDEPPRRVVAAAPKRAPGDKEPAKSKAAPADEEPVDEEADDDDYDPEEEEEEEEGDDDEEEEEEKETGRRSASPEAKRRSASPASTVVERRSASPEAKRRSASPASTVAERRSASPEAKKVRRSTSPETVRRSAAPAEEQIDPAVEAAARELEEALQEAGAVSKHAANLLSDPVTVETVTSGGTAAADDVLTAGQRQALAVASSASTSEALEALSAVAELGATTLSRVNLRRNHKPPERFVP